MGCCIIKADERRPPLPMTQVGLQSEELDPRDFISEGDDYMAHIRFNKYDEETVAASDVLCYQIELARERLLLLEIKTSRVLHSIRRLKADLKTIRQMEAGIITPIAFGIDPTSILQSQLAEQESVLHGYIKRTDVARRDLDRCYGDIMRFWDAAYSRLLESEHDAAATATQNRKTPATSRKNSFIFF